MDRDELQSMTVAQLKILLEENSLSKSGKKSDLIDRLLENSFSLDEEEDFLILEEEDFDDELEITKSSSSTPSDEKIEIMEATILEAVLVEDVQTPDTPSMKVREPTSKKSEPMIEIKIPSASSFFVKSWMSETKWSSLRILNMKINNKQQQNYLM